MTRSSTTNVARIAAETRYTEDKAIGYLCTAFAMQVASSMQRDEERALAYATQHIRAYHANTLHEDARALVARVFAATNATPDYEALALAAGYITENTTTHAAFASLSTSEQERMYDDWCQQAREDVAPIYCVTAIGDVEERAPFTQVARARMAARILSRTLNTRVTVWRANDGEVLASYLRGKPIV